MDQIHLSGDILIPIPIQAMMHQGVFQLKAYWEVIVGFMDQIFFGKMKMNGRSL